MYDADDEMNRLHEFMRDEAAFREEQEARDDKRKKDYEDPKD
jgi:hypothetical protein